MQNPWSEASIPIENPSNDPIIFRTPAGELHLMSLPPPPEAEEIPARKKPRLAEPLPTTTDQATRKTTSPDFSLGLSPPPAADIDDDLDADAVTDTQPNAGAAQTNRRLWTLEEDAKLTHAVANTPKKRFGKEYRTDWVAVAALVPGRKKQQCSDRWRDTLVSIIDQATSRVGRWTEDEDIKLKVAVLTAGKRDWGAISAQVPGRARCQCKNRWHNVLNLNITPTARRTGKWTEDEDSKLKDAVQTHGSKDWDAISALVPGRTKSKCWSRWDNVLDPSIDQTSPGRTGKWVDDEDSMLKDAVQIYGRKNWNAVAALVPGRTRMQCLQRWHNVLDPNIGRASTHRRKWTADEDSKLKDAVQKYGDNNWVAIATLVPGRTKIQCYHRWRDTLDPSIGRGSGRTGKWTADEDSKLKDSVKTHSGKNWGAIAALVPGRTKMQCKNRWHNTLNPSIALTAGRTG
jgi:hypothetical protein